MAEDGIRIESGLKRAGFRRAIFLLPAAAGVAAYVFLPVISQPESYHQFADGRTILRVPNFWNVVSNLPFAIVGVMGLSRFGDLTSRILFLGIFLVAFGSGYYHWAPTSATLAWDRAPMTIAFMALLAMIVGECWSVRSGNVILLPLIAVGIFSVAWWRYSGDLRLYGLVQFVPILTIVAAVLVFPEPRNKYLWVAFTLYAGAKLCEALDRQIFAISPLSGHTIKHLLAAYSTYWIYRWRLAAEKINAPRAA